jgi:hypothetical protein
MKYLDYIYYRVYCFYKEKKETNYHIMGILVVTIIQFAILFSFITLLTLFLFEMPSFKNWQSLIGMILFFIYTWNRYSNVIEFSVLEMKWFNEDKKQKKTRGFFIVFLLFLFIFFPIFIGYLRHNLGMNL